MARHMSYGERAFYRLACWAYLMAFIIEKLLVIVVSIRLQIHMHIIYCSLIKIKDGSFVETPPFFICRRCCSRIGNFPANNP